MKCYDEVTEVEGKQKVDDEEVFLDVGWVGN